MDHEQHPSSEKEPQTPPSIWVGSLSDYNNGILFGDWLDAARDAADIHKDIQAMLARSPTAARSGLPAEEWGIFDFDGFGPVQIGEYEDLAYVATVARGAVEHGPGFLAWASIAERDELAEFEDRFAGHADSVAAYVDAMVADLGYDRLLDDAVPPPMRPYVSIDTAALARDMQLSGDLTAVNDPEGGCWLFHNQ